MLLNNKSTGAFYINNLIKRKQDKVYIFMCLIFMYVLTNLCKCSTQFFKWKIREKRNK